MDIKKAIKNRGKTISAVAEVIGITQSALTLQIQNNSLTIKKLKIIASYLGITVSELVADEETPKPSPPLTCPHCGKKLNLTISINVQ